LLDQLQCEQRRRGVVADRAQGAAGEEFGVEMGTGPWTWVLDPIDGTKSFITGEEKMMKYGMFHW
jgi:myo-inositol-1(or 4)-monophosphatase